MISRKFQRTLTIALAITLLMACFMPAASAVEAAGTAKTTAAATLYSGPGTENSALGQVKKGVTVTVLEYTEGSAWVRVIALQKEGFIAASALDLSGLSASTASAPQAGYAANTTRLRETADTRARSIDTLNRNTAVEVLEVSATWWKVSFNNKIGYAASKDMKLGTPPATANTTPGRSTSTSTSSTPKTDVNAAKITKAKGINSDTVGWISVPNTNVDEPILYGANFYYATHNINKKKSYEGVYPFAGRMTSNVVIFGHNLRGSNNVFHQMHHLKDAALGYSKCQSGACGKSLSSDLGNWYKSSAGRIWNVSIYGTQRWEVFAMYEVPKNEPKSTLRNNWNTSPGNMDAWIKGQLSRSQINFGVSVSSSDKIMTLITCGTNYDSATANSRLFIFLKNVD